MQDEISTYRRRLPLWRMSGAVYFVTWRLHPSQSYLTSEEQEVVTSALKHFDGERYELLAYVVMHNHVHVLVSPKGNHRLQDIVFSWKSFTARVLQRKFRRRYSIWQDEYFDRIVQDEAEFIEKAQYILNNPLKTWPDIQEYKWVWVKILAGAEARPTGAEARPTGENQTP
jgi:REP element-mobilizing transposase RayT